MDKFVLHTEIERKAAKMLERCESAQLASITEKGDPLFCILKFTTVEALFFIGRQSVVCEY
ncbi:MAG: hypothetical protein LBD58_08935 [Treponema sp.]|nr:hypothetical protein [Treponema sp.]